MIKTADLHWAAGFLDGEGSFGSCGQNVRYSITGVQKYCDEPIRKLKHLFGGSVSWYRDPRPGIKPGLLYRWQVTGPTARGLMMTLFPLLSAKRRDKIRQVLARDRYTVRWPQPRRHFSEAFKAEVLAEHAAGASQFSLQQKHRLSGTRLSRWVRDAAH